MPNRGIWVGQIENSMAYRFDAFKNAYSGFRETLSPQAHSFRVEQLPFAYSRNRSTAHGSQLCCRSYRARSCSLVFLTTVSKHERQIESKVSSGLGRCVNPGREDISSSSAIKILEYFLAQIDVEFQEACGATHLLTYLFKGAASSGQLLSGLRSDPGTSNHL